MRSEPKAPLKQIVLQSFGVKSSCSCRDEACLASCRHFECIHKQERERGKPPTTRNFDLNPSHFDLKPEDLKTLATKLQVAQRVALAETLSYSATCRMNRGEQVDSTNLLEIWDAIPESLKMRDRQLPEARIIILGINPRNPQTCTTATHTIPHTTKLLAKYINQQAPDLHFACISLRLNADKGPHRDMNNSNELSFIQVLTKTSSGGNIWIADPSGTVPMQVHGSEVRGKIAECHAKPLLFESKTKLHATEPWEGDRRLALVAWTPLARGQSTLDMLTTDFGFPLNKPPKTIEPQSLRQSSLERAFQMSKPESGKGSHLEQQMVFTINSSTSSSCEDTQIVTPTGSRSPSPQTPTVRDDE